MKRFWHDLFGHTNILWLDGRKAFCTDCGHDFWVVL